MLETQFSLCTVQQIHANNTDPPCALHACCCAASPLLYTDRVGDSHFIQSLPKDVRQALQATPIAMENHAKGEGLGIP
jgi:hypothetical protein